MSSRQIVPVVCAAIALGLGACGGEDSEPEGAPPTTAPAEQTTGAATTTTTTGDAGAGTTKPGATLKIGDTAHLKRQPLSNSSLPAYDLDVTVLELERGSIDDFENVNLDEDQKQSTPFYVTARIANPAGSDVPADDDPALGLDGIDDRGQEQGRVIFLGTFDRCDYANVPKPFAKSKSYETCLVFLVPGGGSIEEVHWSGSEEYISDPVTWK